MNIYVYLLGSLAGIGLLVGLNLLLTGRSRARVGLEAANALLAAENPGFRAARAVLTRDSKAALVEDERGTVHLIAAAGDRLVSRKLSPASVLKLARSGETLTLRFRDVTFPGARLSLGGEPEAQAWEARLRQALG